jgi:predicted secreted hydrolase
MVRADGTTTHLNLNDYRVEVLDHWTSPNSEARYPMKWKVRIPSEEIELEITPAFSEQELITQRSTRVTYWEGAVRVQGFLKKRPIAGQGYVEMTGYAGKLKI